MPLAERNRARDALLELVSECRENGRVAVLERGVEEVRQRESFGRFPVGVHEFRSLGIAESYIGGDIEIHLHLRLRQEFSEDGAPADVQEDWTRASDAFA